MSGNIDTTRIEEVKSHTDDVEDDADATKISAMLLCEICNIKVTSNKILQRHLDGRKHKMRVERKGKIYYCDVCDLTANSETQLNIHLLSARHKSRVSRKEFNEFTNFSTNAKALCVVIICVLIVFGNLIVLFRATPT